ncbi:MAG TPA: serine hydrolase domain-containing protein [Hyphomicrobiaceae bacterium]|nr:serine hydrolase domain-containing protein [Hyphomicrobiaceae bacterium]
MRKHLLSLAVIAISATSALAMTDGELHAVLEKRFKDDRTGACVAAAVIEKARTSKAYVCAKDERPYDEHTAFEIGSVSKPMTAALLAELIARGEISLDDPVIKLLPQGATVPTFNGQRITIRHIVTHTSGLPSFPPQWQTTGAGNPYGRITERRLLTTLAATRLMRPPGARWEYSNFAMMVLSYALSRHTGKDFETLLRERLLAPLGMNETYVATPPPRVHLAQGHYGNGSRAEPWSFQPEMGGVGGVRSTLPDMVRFVEGQLGTRASAITPALARTQEKLVSIGGQTMAMCWSLLPMQNGQTALTHAGNTGGFSSFVAVDPAAGSGVVLLSDTSLFSVGSFGSLGLHLLDPTVALEPPRRTVAADPKLIDALAGSYHLPIGIGMTLRRKGDALTVQAEAQPEFVMGYDSAGDFYPLAFDALLKPRRRDDGSYAFIWIQGGAAFEAWRSKEAPAKAAGGK